MDAKPKEIDSFHIYKSDKIKANQFYFDTNNILFLKSSKLIEILTSFIKLIMNKFLHDVK